MRKLLFLWAISGQRYPGRRHSPGWNGDARKESIGGGNPSMAKAGTFGKGYSATLGLRGFHAPPTSINHTLTPTNVTGQLGATIYLHCYVHNAGQKTVTWVRRADYHILTVGMVTYTTDDRFSAVRGETPHPLSALASIGDGRVVGRGSRTLITASATVPAEDWMLQIRNVQKSDAGEYECQVNTQFPIISSQIVLNVLSPHASIVEGTEVFVNGGSVVSLTCVIHDCSQPPTHVFWYHGDRVVNYDSRDARDRINITSLLHEVPQNGSTSGPRRASRLVIRNAGKQHSGSYTCAPVDSTPATVQVHVLHGKQTASSAHAHMTTIRISLNFYPNVLFDMEQK
ncbi:hypothetical protein BIW11_12493 [Tropilaelaps mercedesae]|uniref:Ig-like domain-containing protein n=1 Tax=Tropilaelaps mercedesae TaxID=418985 RepID=A0A1V9X6P4_9ACAR|nr:hypothetical protein BIW11_12493 [Tropilaelaps mercedesae]